MSECENDMNKLFFDVLLITKLYNIVSLWLSKFSHLRIPFKK